MPQTTWVTHKSNERSIRPPKRPKPLPVGDDGKLVKPQISPETIIQIEVICAGCKMAPVRLRVAAHKTWDTFPVRKIDNTKVVKMLPAYSFKHSLVSGEEKLVKRAGGFEKQFCLECPRCSKVLSYCSSEPGAERKFMFFYETLVSTRRHGPVVPKPAPYIIKKEPEIKKSESSSSSDDSDDVEEVLSKFTKPRRKEAEESRGSLADKAEQRKNRVSKTFQERESRRRKDHDRNQNRKRERDRESREDKDKRRGRGRDSNKSREKDRSTDRKTDRDRDKGRNRHRKLTRKRRSPS